MASGSNNAAWELGRLRPYDRLEHEYEYRTRYPGLYNSPLPSFLPATFIRGGQG